MKRLLNIILTVTILLVASLVNATPYNRDHFEPSNSKVTKVVKSNKVTKTKHKVSSKKKFTKPSKRVSKKILVKHRTKGVKLPPLTLYDYIEDSCRINCANHELLLDSVNEASKNLNLDPKMLLAIIRVESSFSVKAKNGSNTGLNQVNLRYHKPKFTQKNYYDVRDNTRVGAIVFRDCVKLHKGSTPKALRCYNGGGDPGYVKKVMEKYKEIDNLLDFHKPSTIDLIAVVD